MALVKFGTKSTENNFDLTDINMKSIRGEFNGNPEIGDGFIKLPQDNANYFTLNGRFDLESGAGSLFDVVDRISSIKAVADRQLSYTVSGLDIGKNDVASNADFVAYLAQEAYNITGNDFKNRLVTAGLDDVLNGLGGDDYLSGMNGKDKISGGAGADRILGGGGNDLLTGGSSADTFVFNLASGKDTIVDFMAKGGGHDSLDLTAIANLSRFTQLDIDKVRGGIEIGFEDRVSIFLKNVDIHDFDRSDILL